MTPGRVSRIHPDVIRPLCASAARVTAWTSCPAARAAGWAVLFGAVHVLVFWFVTSGPRVAFCTNCTNGHLLNAGDVVRYFHDTSPTPPRELALVEYPPLARVVVLAPRLLVAQADAYARVFAFEMLICDLLAVLIIARWSAATAGAAAVPRRLAWYTAYVAALSPLAYTRFDLVPTVLAFAAAVAWNSGRSTLGAVGAAFGTLTKLFPGCVAAVGFVHEMTRGPESRMRGTLAFIVALPALTALSWTFGGHTLFLSYLDRNLQLESTFAGILMIVGRVAGLPMAIVPAHGAAELWTNGTHLLAMLTLPLQGALLCATLYACWRARGVEFLRFTAAAILALVVPAKVLSPQYLLWLTPFIAVLENGAGQRTRWVFLACCVGTTVIFPVRYADLTHFHWWAIGLLNARNALLLVLLGLLAGTRPAGGSTDPRPEEQRPGEVDPHPDAHAYPDREAAPR
jgi:hypothetical protein